MKSPRHHRSEKRSRWAHANTPEALRRRRAAADACREALAATLPPIPDDPAPGDPWQSVIVLDASGSEMWRLDLLVPRRGSRCDQHADADGRLLTATEIGRRVAAQIVKRASVSVLAEMRR